MKKRILALALSIILCFSLVACSSDSNIKPPKEFDKKFNTSNPEGFVAAENERFTLSWNEEEKCIVFLDKEKNIPWSYRPYQSFEKKYDSEGYEINNHPQVLSPISITYRDIVKYITDTTVGYNGSIKKKDFSVSKIDDGLSVCYNFANEKINITVDYVLRDDNLLMTIDPNKITEGDKYKLTSISVAPFFCSIPNQTKDTYLFVPSGSGTLVYADSPNENVISITEEVYGSDTRHPKDAQIKTVTSNVRMPVYGAKNGNNAIFAIIEQGAEAAVINTKIGNDGIGYSSVSSDFELRSYDTLTLANGTGKRLVYSDSFTSNVYSVAFYPLYDDEADYVGFAKCYREYLDDIQVTKTTSEENMLNLEMLGGTTVTESILGIPYDTVFPTTTISDAKQMISELYDKTGESATVQLLGFGESGLEIGKIAGNFKLNKKIGNTEDLKELVDYTKDKGIALFMDYDTVFFKKSSSAASSSFGSATTSTGRITTLRYYHMRSGTQDASGAGWNNTSTFNVLKRSLIPEILEKATKATKNYGLSGISLSTLSSVAYSDHAMQKYHAKGQMADQVSAEFKKISDNGLEILTTDANAYAAINSDYIFDVPLKSSDFDIYDTDVPFYQIVFKGKVSMAGTPLTIAGDINESLLKSLESGVGLTFALTSNYTNDIIGSSQVRYYGSNYALVKDMICDIVSEYKDYYASIDGASICQHKIISNTLRMTEFDNGVKIFVNYGNQPIETEIGIVDAMSYKYTGGNGADE